ncbi:anthrone oxygenase family protein [Micromonospora sp. NPDC005413]|uniref:anthrone oxygenase family protein n=1 Tax=Micromonospora sp. NPDC005413 TaxID=3154563 RepID=UPI0033BF77A7
MRLAQHVSLIAATITTGLMAGLFAAFAYAVMPALKGADDRTFVDTMQRINVTIVNGWFMLGFLGALVFAALSALLAWRGEGRPALPWIIGGLALYLAMFIITAAVNVPLNDKLASAGSPGHIADLAAVREHFESSWVAWNIVRALANTAAFGCLTWALIVYGRTTV